MRLSLQLQAYTTTGTLHYYPNASSPYIRHFERGPKNERQFHNTTFPPASSALKSTGDWHKANRPFEFESRVCLKVQRSLFQYSGIKRLIMKALHPLIKPILNLLTIESGSHPP